MGRLCLSLLPEELRDKTEVAEPEYYNLRPGYIFYSQLDFNQR